jgi:hypothetical protein
MRASKAEGGGRDSRRSPTSPLNSWYVDNAAFAWQFRLLGLKRSNADQPRGRKQQSTRATRDKTLTSGVFAQVTNHTHVFFRIESTIRPPNAEECSTEISYESHVAVLSFYEYDDDMPVMHQI